MSIEVEVPQTTISNKAIEVEYSNSNTAIAEGTKELEVTVNRREYNIVGDELYIPKRYEDAPQWLRDIIDTVTSTAISGAISDVSTLGDMLDGLIAELNVAKNTYTMSIISDNDINERITTAIETLNSSLAESDSTILNIALTRVTPEEAQAIAIGILSASINGGDIAAAVQNLQSAIADVDSARALDYTRLTAQIGEGLDEEVAARAEAVQYLNTYVGIDADGGLVGTGLLADVSILQKQNDGIIETVTGTYDVMVNPENQDLAKLILTAEPYATWMAADVSGINTRLAHIGDVYIKYSITGNGAREYIASYKFIRTVVDTTSPFSTDNHGFTWALIVDQAAQDAYNQALSAYDLADGKRRVYVGLGAAGTPKTPYDQGDLWLIDTARTVNWYSAKVGDILRCVESKVVEGATYEQNDWVLASSYANAIQAEATALENWKNTTYASTITALQTQVDKKAETFYQNSMPSGRLILTNVVADVELDKYVGDLWKNTYVGTISGYLGNNTEYMYSKVANGTKWDYKWVEMEVPDIVFDAIDTKKAIFVGNTLPVNPEINDMWITGDAPVGGRIAKTIYTWNGILWVIPVRYTDDQYAKDIVAGTTQIDLSDHINSLGWTDDATVDEFIISTYAKDMLNIGNQLDGVAVTYFQATKPYLESVGLSEHSGDVWFNTSNETAFKFVYKTVDASGNVLTPSIWEPITNTVILNALKAASKTKAAADRSIKNFTTTTVPSHPFYIGDTWMEGSSGNIYVCNANSLSSDTETQRRAKWVIASKYTDDTSVTALQNGLANGSTTIKLTNAYVGTVPLTTYLSSEIDGKVGVYSGTTAPVAGQPSGVAVNDIYLWFTTRVAAGTTYDITVTYKYNGSAWVEITTNDDITNLADLADGKRTIFGGATVPTGALDRDIWIPSANNGSYVKGEIYQYIGGVWSATTRYTADMQALTSNVQTQIDSKVDTYYQATVPFANATNVARKTQAGDYWYCTLTSGSYVKGKMYKYTETANGSNWNYTWTETADVTKYAFDLADGKAAIFTTSAQPSSYKINDMMIVTTATFSNGTTSFSNGVVLTSNATRTSGFVAADWVKKINDTEDLDEFVSVTYTPTVTNLQNQVDGKIESWYTASTSDPKIAWTDTTTRAKHEGDMWYQTDTKKSYWYSSSTHSWNLIDDEKAIQALANAATAQATADGVVVSFYAIKQDTAPTTTSMWLNKTGTKVLKEYKTGWINVAVQTGDTLMAYDPVTKDMSTYVYNGSGWITNTENGIVAGSEAITTLTANLSAANTIVSGHTTQLNTVDTRIANGAAAVETKWAYNSVVNINGVYKKSGFGLTTNYTSGSGTEANPYVSEFWIDASRLKFTNSSMTGRTAPFTIDASGTTPQVTFNGKVAFSNISDSATYIPTISSVTAAQTTANTAIANVIKGTNLIYEDWSIGSGSTTVYSQNGASAENYRVYGNNHLGQRVVLWECRPDANNDGDGGWDTTWFAVDKTKAYRFSVFVKTSANTGTTYLGCGASTVCTLNTTTVDINPYFWAGDLPSQNEWYLLVGYVYPTGNTGMVSSGGIYNCSTGNKVVSIADFNWTSTATSSSHRCYHYYDTTTTTRQYMWNPRVDKIDGNEPSIIDLIGNFTKVEDIAWQSEVQAAINNNATTIDGGKITTGQIAAARINTSGLVADSVRTYALTAWNTTIENGLITNAKISDGAITNAKIGDAQISTAKIGDAQITNAKIGALSVDTFKIQDEAVIVPRYASSLNSSVNIVYTPSITHSVAILSVSKETPSTFNYSHIIMVNGVSKISGSSSALMVLETFYAGTTYTINSAFGFTSDGTYAARPVSLLMLGVKK